jgi:uncharacterized protein
MPVPEWTDVDDHAFRRCRRQLILEVSEDCNLRCRYCHHTVAATHRPHRRRTMTADVAIAAVDDFLATSVETDRPQISFYGGEPLLAMPLIDQVVQYVRQQPGGHRLGFGISTNGLCLDDPHAAALIHHEGMTLQVSIDGPAALHDRDRRTIINEPTHARIEANLTRLLRAEPELAERLVLVATLAPPYDLAAVDAYFAQFPPYIAAGIPGAPIVRINRATDQDAAWRAQLAPLRARYLNGRRSHVLRALFDDAVLAWYHRPAGPLEQLVGRGGCCLPGVRRLYVRADGTLQPCERVGGSCVLGTVDGGLQRDAVNNLMRRFATVLGPDCVRCWASRTCRMCYTDLTNIDDLAARCRTIREGSEAALRLFLDANSAGGPASQCLARTSLR